MKSNFLKKLYAYYKIIDKHNMDKVIEGKMTSEECNKQKDIILQFFRFTASLEKRIRDKS